MGSTFPLALLGEKVTALKWRSRLGEHVTAPKGGPTLGENVTERGSIFQEKGNCTQEDWDSGRK